MKFGIIVNRKLVDRTASDPYGRLYSYLNEMEDLGYDLAWCGQHRFSDTTAFGGDTATEPSAPLAMLAPLMARTTRMQFATNIMLLPAHHPLEVAEQVNTLQEMSGSRFILGAGIGYKPDEFENVGWNFKTRARRFEECLQVLRLALTGERFSFRGDFFSFDDVMVTPPPLPGTHTPLWIGAVSEPAMLRAARLGDGWEISFAEHLLELADKVKRYRSLALENDRPSTLALMRDVHIAPTRDAIDPNFLPNIIRVWQSYEDLGSRADRDELSKEVMFGGKQVTLEEFAPNRAVVGTPEDCCREMQRIREMVNPEYLFITPTGVPDPQQQIAELRLFAREVMPHFRD
ncbi:LLM class flavin-dependent oxidoreductase [Mangrovimicrobium sediminis]|uniref:LLM class flavin-dependent oxidoreductase n=1 Tax=Mangrovimicrobium sediminis TaxID=2562682 RepID=A0A4Z0LU95_9GAMM|nr:LLM class flavin-dependent oxidoreductase [Haliea sp. SAOS-164]TGD70819.1 LLM class flavin-dependent oxidoreductase [Haliea sp. SAOS-164]